MNIFGFNTGQKTKLQKPTFSTDWTGRRQCRTRLEFLAWYEVWGEEWASCEGLMTNWVRVVWRVGLWSYTVHGTRYTADRTQNTAKNCYRTSCIEVQCSVLEYPVIKYMHVLFCLEDKVKLHYIGNKIVVVFLTMAFYPKQSH